jgi:2-oxoglutarate dehydrogenase E1 component
VRRKFRKPLILMTPKSLLRHRAAVSALRELTEGTFHPVLDDVARSGAPEAGVIVDPRGVKRVILCSGKIYYALLAGRRERATDSIALVRLEQLYPFPWQELTAVFATYSAATQIYWVQDEPWNMGAWHFVHPRLQRILPASATLDYVGRSEAASPATGSFKMHQTEEAELVARALAR